MSDDFPETGLDVERLAPLLGREFGKAGFFREGASPDFLETQARLMLLDIDRTLEADMNETAKIDLDELEELAEKATPGKREVIRYKHGAGRIHIGNNLLFDVHDEGDRELAAVLDPETVRELIRLARVGAERLGRLGFYDLLIVGEQLLTHYPPETIVCSHRETANIGARTSAAIADLIASCRALDPSASRFARERWLSKDDRHG